MVNKRQLACLTAICLFVLSMFPISAGAQEAVDCKQEAAILAAVGVMDSAAADAVSGNPTEAMQRGEYTALIMHLMGFETGIDVEESAFSDVPSSMAYAPEIMMAYQLGMVQGYSDGTFGPNETITTGEAMKILVSALGYSFRAQQQGGYPSGYMLLASELGISRGMSIAASDELTKGEAVMMLYNALEVDICRTVTVGSQTTLTVTEGQNALTEFLDYDVAEGVITANDVTGLGAPGEKAAANRVHIDGVPYNAGGTNAASYLGYHVRAYYQVHESDIGQLVYVVPYRTEVITIDGADILSYTDGVLRYEQDNGSRIAEKRVRIPVTADVIYNGIADLDYTNADFMMEEGSLTLLENNSDGDIDVALLNVTYNRVVNSVNQTDKIIYTRSPQGKIDLSELETEDISIVDANGSAVEFSALKADDVLTVASSRDGSKVSMVVSTEQEAGEINEIIDEDQAMINYYLRTISDNFRSEFANLSVGYAGTFLFDAQGRVAGIASGSAAGSKAYGIVGGIAREGAIDRNMLIQIYTAEGVLETLTVADNIKADGYTLTDEEFYDQYTLASGGGRYFDSSCRVVKFGTNADGELNYIDTKREDNGGNLDTSLKEMDCRNLNSGQGVRWKNSTRSFSSSVLTDTNTVFFNMPVVEAGGDPAEVNGFAAKSYSNSVALTDNVYYKFLAYDVDDGGYSPLIVMETSYSSDDPIGGTAGNAPALDSTFAMVDHISTVVNAEGDTVPKLYIAVNGNILGYEALNDNVVKKPSTNDFFKQGDIIRYNLNADNVIVGTAVEWDVDNITAGSFVMQSGNDNGKAIGQVYSQKNGNIKISTTAREAGDGFEFVFEQDDPTVPMYVYPVGTTTVTVFDSEEEEIYAGNAGDIVDYKSDPDDASIVFIQTKWYEMRQVFILK